MIPPEIMADLEELADLLERGAEFIRRPENTPDTLEDLADSLEINAQTLRLHKRRLIVVTGMPHRPNH